MSNEITSIPYRDTLVHNWDMDLSGLDFPAMLEREVL
jgi:hypothetical protein